MVLKLLGYFEDHNLVHRRANKKYDGNQTMQAIYTAQRLELSGLRAEFIQTFLNRFIATANLETILSWERILNILADPETEDLEVRRARVLNYISTNSPFTRIWLLQYLNEIFEGYETSLDIRYNEYTVPINVVSSDVVLMDIFEGLIEFLRNIIPANMVIETKLDMPYTHSYLARFTHYELQQFTFGELSQFAI